MRPRRAQPHHVESSHRTNISLRTIFQLKADVGKQLGYKCLSKKNRTVRRLCELLMLNNSPRYILYPEKNKHWIRLGFGHNIFLSLLRRQ